MIRLLLEAIVFILGAATLVTQVIIPLFKGTALFPIFNKERREIASGITEVLSDAEVAELRKEYEEFREQVKPVASVETETKETEK